MENLKSPPVLNRLLENWELRMRRYIEHLRIWKTKT